MFSKQPIFGTFFAFALLTSTVFAQTQGFLGIRAKKGDNFEQCAVIEQLAPGGPAARAGLAPGDVIASIDQVPVDCAGIQQGSPLVPRVKAGDRVVFKVLRAGKAVEIAVLADGLPVEMSRVEEEQARREAGHAVFQRLVKSQEVFTVTLVKGGGFELSGKMTAQELADLHFYFDQGREGAMFTKEMKSDRQDMYVRFDRERGAVLFEFVDAQNR